MISLSFWGKDARAFGPLGTLGSRESAMAFRAPETAIPSRELLSQSRAWIQRALENSITLAESKRGLTRNEFRADLRMLLSELREMRRSFPRIKISTSLDPASRHALACAQSGQKGADGAVARVYHADLNTIYLCDRVFRDYQIVSRLESLSFYILHELSHAVGRRNECLADFVASSVFFLQKIAPVPGAYIARSCSDGFHALGELAYDVTGSEELFREYAANARTHFKVRAHFTPRGRVPALRVVSRSP